MDTNVNGDILAPEHPSSNLWEDPITECKQKLVQVQELHRRLEDLCDSLERARLQDQQVQGDKNTEAKKIEAQGQSDIEQSFQRVAELDTNEISFRPGFSTRIKRAIYSEHKSPARRRSHSANVYADIQSQLEADDEHTADADDTRSSKSHLANTSGKRRQAPEKADNIPQIPSNEEILTPHYKQMDDQMPHIIRAWPLEAEEYKRYGRQLIMPEVGLQGQLRLKHARVLVIGAGGLGCPAAAYLAGAGVGTLGIVDGDIVELSNLHRQILHTTDTIGMLKVHSVIKRLKSMNPLVKYAAHKEHLAPENALGIISKYDIVLDCTDRPTSRYLISDACVIMGKPLVSASALRTDGQLTILNYPAAPAGDESGGPCYRCVWPKPPPANNVVSCGEGGILGPVVGVMGVLMALEAVKMISSGGLEPKPPREDEASNASPHRPTMLIFSATSPRPFQTVRLQSRRKDCPACSSQATISAESLTSGSTDYVAFCGVRSAVRILPPEQRLTPTDYAAKIGTNTMAQDLVDVREKVQYDLCHMHGSINVPWSDMEQWEKPKDIDDAVKALLSRENNELTFVCREGNDSQLAVRKMQQLGTDEIGLGSPAFNLKDITGGWEAWRRDVDAEWPQY